MEKPVVTLKIPEGVNVSDGYHTFTELYEHRIELWMSLCRMATAVMFIPWKTRKHSDGTGIDGWFLLGIDDRPGKQITYHLPDKYWAACDFAEERERAPEFDGHTSADVLERLRKL